MAGPGVTCLGGRAARAVAINAILVGNWLAKLSIPGVAPLPFTHILVKAVCQLSLESNYEASVSPIIGGHIGVSIPNMHGQFGRK